MKPISLLEQGQGFSLNFPLIPTFGTCQAQEGQDQRRLVTHRVRSVRFVGSAEIVSRVSWAVGSLTRVVPRTDKLDKAELGALGVCFWALNTQRQVGMWGPHVGLFKT